MRIYIVDNSEPLRRSLRSMLEDIPGIKIAGEAGSVRQAVKGILASRPDGVLLDIRLRDGSGLEVLRSVRAKGQNPKFILFTGFAEARYRRIFRDEGVAYFFEKSADEDELMRCLLAMASAAAGTGEGRHSLCCIAPAARPPGA